MTKRIMILGAGYSGLKCALTIEGKIKKNSDAEVLLVDKKDFHHLTTQMPGEGGKGRTKEVRVPLEEILHRKNIKMIQDEVLRILPAEKSVLLKKGRMDYDYLVVALGAEADHQRTPGLEEYGFDYRLLNSEKVIKEHIENCFELYNNTKPFSRDLLSFVISGGGLTGISLALKLTGWVEELSKGYDVSSKSIKMIYIDKSIPILVGYERQLIENAMIQLTEKGVQIIPDSGIEKIDGRQVRLETGEVIKTRTFIWTGDFNANAVIAASGLPVVVRGRARVNRYLQTPDYEDIYMIGDNAFLIDYAREEIIGPMAHVSIESGSIAAENIYADLYQRDLVSFKVGTEPAFSMYMTTVPASGSRGRRTAPKKGRAGFPWKYLYSVGGFGLVARKLLKK